MTIYISNQKIIHNAPIGTAIGALNAKLGSTHIPCTFALLNNPNNYFAISGFHLVTAQNAPLVVGQYSVKVKATPITLSDMTTFVITIT